jgi:sulfide dehydrogenase cytochrome subunit
MIRAAAQGLTFRGPAFLGLALRNLAFGGLAFGDLVFKGMAFKGMAFKGMAFRGMAFRGMAFRGMAFLGVIAVLAAAPPPPGASSCSGCHGAASPIAGMNAAQMTQTLIAYRSGAKPSTVMGRITKGFSDDELTAIATWWAARK